MLAINLANFFNIDKNNNYEVKEEEEICKDLIYYVILK